MLSLDKVVLRKVTPHDVDLLLNWANDPSVRDNAVNGEAIAYSDHIAWFHAKHSDENCRMWIGTKNGSPCGQVRVDIDSNLDGWITYSVDANHRNKGVGSALIKALFEQTNIMAQVGALKAIVKESNLASKKIFFKCGFEIERKEVNLLYFKKPLPTEGNESV